MENNKVIEKININIGFNNSYNLIKDKINVDKVLLNNKQEKRQFKLKYAFVVSLVLVIIVIEVFLLTNLNKQISYNMIIYNNDLELIKKCEYIFIGKVNKLEKGYEHDQVFNGNSMSFVLYDIEVVEYLKNTKEVDSSRLAYYGASVDYIDDNTNIENLDENKYYLFFLDIKKK